ncbi:hypothetical protein PIB30_031154 [Stylosanthes scabra]|uniref:Alpha-L-arabinofuranosidase 1 catalytic domain-containing protein n=1 Tax=Stylosanthes scabra TaxID=79078 RepID=A0ABU6YDR4_9FABA|nr:hypothetical protein [Stylosanthes scabra]
MSQTHIRFASVFLFLRKYDHHQHRSRRGRGGNRSESRRLCSLYTHSKSLMRFLGAVPTFQTQTVLECLDFAEDSDRAFVLLVSSAWLLYLANVDDVDSLNVVIQNGFTQFCSAPTIHAVLFWGMVRLIDIPLRISIAYKTFVRGEEIMNPQEELVGIEFARGDATSKWDSLRAAMGHSEPYDLKYVYTNAKHMFARATAFDHTSRSGPNDGRNARKFETKIYQVPRTWKDKIDARFPISLFKAQY